MLNNFPKGMQLVSGENLIRGQVSTLLSSVPPPLTAPLPPILLVFLNSSVRICSGGNLLLMVKLSNITLWTEEQKIHAIWCEINFD